MSNQSETTVHKINYRSATLVITEHNNVPYVDMQQIVEGMGLNWRHHKRTLKYDAISLYPDRAEAAEDRGHHPAICMLLIKLHSWLMGLKQERYARRVREEISAWQNDCVDQLWSNWSQTRTQSDVAISTVNARYHGKRFRFRRIGNEWWYAASDVVVALGIRNTTDLLKTLPQSTRIRLQIGHQQLHAINQAGLDKAYLMAPPFGSESLRTWLSNLQQDHANPRVPPELSICKDSADATLDYLSRCRQSLRDAGALVVEWDDALAQRIASSAASMLIRNRRWLLALNDHGEPHLSVVPQDAGVFTSEGLVKWVRDPAGARLEVVTSILSAIGERLSCGAD
ncbi:phage antirepressor N-terminal domain-containing protein [Pseudomonas viridiflava]|uniref:phage antirepressor N-terminal domain-containing protein n=1 Tax=Pseudomonas viridiflava TaxID=33069 RepID=UPI0013CEE790|nr:phage antirepressor N-terminal domain-containing protein [Pseudomonas viridiflava]